MLKLTCPGEMQRLRRCVFQSQRSRRSLEVFPAPASAWKRTVQGDDEWKQFCRVSTRKMDQRQPTHRSGEIKKTFCVCFQAAPLENLTDLKAARSSKTFIQLFLYPTKTQTITGDVQEMKVRGTSTSFYPVSLKSQNLNKPFSNFCSLQRRIHLPINHPPFSRK